MPPISGRGCPILGAYHRLEPDLVQFRPDRRRHRRPASTGYQVLLKVVSRSNADPMYRSDATYFERLYAEALIDLSPEEVANAVRAKF